MAPKKSPPKRGGGAPLGAKSLWCPRVPCEDPRRAPSRRATSGDILWPPSAGFSPVAQARRSFARLTRRPTHSSAGGRSGNPRGRNASSWRGGPGRAGMSVRDEPICPAPSSGAVPRPAIKTPRERAPQNGRGNGILPQVFGAGIRCDGFYARQIIRPASPPTIFGKKKEAAMMTHAGKPGSRN